MIGIVINVVESHPGEQKWGGLLEPTDRIPYIGAAVSDGNTPGSAKSMYGESVLHFQVILYSYFCISRVGCGTLCTHRLFESYSCACNGLCSTSKKPGGNQLCHHG